MEIAGIRFDGTAENISLKGMFVATDYPATIEDKIALRFCLSGAQGAPGMTVKGRVAWVKPAHHANRNVASGLGVEFLEITGEGLAILRKTELCEFIESRRRSEEP
jgi:Tfp pilus assembly protein PilZ